MPVAYGMPIDQQPPPVRVGIGYDVHRLTSERPLLLGGVTVPHERGLAGHSDAEVMVVDPERLAEGAPKAETRTGPDGTFSMRMSLFIDDTEGPRLGEFLGELDAEFVGERLRRDG